MRTKLTHLGKRKKRERRNTKKKKDKKEERQKRRKTKRRKTKKKKDKNKTKTEKGFYFIFGKCSKKYSIIKGNYSGGGSLKNLKRCK